MYLAIEAIKHHVLNAFSISSIKISWLCLGDFLREIVDWALKISAKGSGLSSRRAAIFPSTNGNSG